ncbi:MAG: S8 family serine peptidase [Bacteroidia bacterium]|nr:S8 family serine peptidase [Bacteroidia bacterium]MCF8425329.1 S8 family serine peptidase [Bacteroidia bacterium]MCF8446094.1 S8 family serine peptidase [Bacteroidia bacterium]
MKFKYLLLVFQAFWVFQINAQKASFFYSPEPNSSKEFWGQWNHYSLSNPLIPITFHPNPTTDCSFDSYGWNGQPQFLCTCNNIDAARTLGTSNLWPSGSLGLSLSGAGVSGLALWDGGSARTSHRELLGRVSVMDSPSTLSSHTTAVVGNLIATGINSNVHGMSYQAQLKNWNFSNDNAEIIAAGPDLLVSNHSYASTTAWQNIGGNWYWYGDSSLNQFKDWKFGYYDNRSRIWDSVMFQNPYYLMVKAAGNDRGSAIAPGTTHYYWNGTAWALTNTTRDTVGPYDCISTFGTAKNLLTVGAVQVLPNGFGGPSSISMLSYSSWGPTDDGRIKPDLVAASGSILSTGSSHDSSYATLGGTSMSSPNVAGSLLLLQQYFHQINGHYLRNSTLKGLAIHTADRCKALPGPDYQCGWGLPNMLRAISVIQDSINNTIQENTLLNNDTFETDIYVTAGDTVRITIAWTDPKGITSAPVFNDTTPKLVNDLDLRLCNVLDSVLAYPFILNPSNPSIAATTGDNFRDNIEQIYVPSLPAARYRIKVSHKNQLLNQSSQNFSLLISGAPLYTPSLPVAWLKLNGQVLSWKSTQLNWETAQEINNLGFEIQYSLDGELYTHAGFVKSLKTNSFSVSKYQFLHQLNNGIGSKIYYRIKQIDINGSSSYSRIIVLENDLDWRVNSIYPNPFSQIITIQISSKNPSENVFNIYAMTGQLVHTETKIINNSEPVLVDLSGLNRGAFILEINEIGSDQFYRGKIIKN